MAADHPQSNWTNNIEKKPVEPNQRPVPTHFEGVKLARPEELRLFIDAPHDRDSKDPIGMGIPPLVIDAAEWANFSGTIADASQAIHDGGKTVEWLPAFLDIPFDPDKIHTATQITSLADALIAYFATKGITVTQSLSTEDTLDELGSHSCHSTWVGNLCKAMDEADNKDSLAKAVTKVLGDKLPKDFDSNNPVFDTDSMKKAMIEWILDNYTDKSEASKRRAYDALVGALESETRLPHVEGNSQYGTVELPPAIGLEIDKDTKISDLVNADGSGKLFDAVVDLSAASLQARERSARQSL